MLSFASEVVRLRGNVKARQLLNVLLRKVEQSWPEWDGRLTATPSSPPPFVTLFGNRAFPAPFSATTRAFWQPRIFPVALMIIVRAPPVYRTTKMSEINNRAESENGNEWPLPQIFFRLRAPAA